MKKAFVLFIVATIVYACSNSERSLTIKGSDTLLPLAQKWSEIYTKTNPSVKVTVTGGGSGVGIASLIEGTTDIAAASRKLKMDEKLKLQDAKKDYKEVVVANDALTVIVNPSNKVSQLTREQIEGIYTGKITNWKEVGGDDLAIVIYSRESSSGTYEFFKEHVLNKKDFIATCLMMPATGSIVQSVSQTEGAIGYIGLAYVDPSVKSLSVSYDQGTTFVKPTPENAKNKTYPIVRELYFYYLTSSESTLQPFIDWILSVEGQKIVSDEGYLTLQ